MANQSIHPITQPSGIAQARQNDPMFSKTISIKVIFALALAISMAWAGHSSVLLVGTTQVDWSSNGDAHPHAHDEVFSCALCADHYHSSVTADHVHETPHLPVLMSVGLLPKRTLPIDAPLNAMPLGPIFLIERPPRSRFVI